MEKKTKLLNIALICDSLDHITGGSFYSVTRFAFKLKERGHNVIIITTKRVEETSTQNSGTNIDDKFKDFTVYRFFSSFPIGKDKFRFMLLKESSLEEIFIRHKIDVVYAIHPIYSGLVAINVARKLNLPVVMHMHVQPENMLNINPSTSGSADAVYKYFSLFYNRSDVVLCPSKLGKELLLKSNVTVPIEVVTNGVDKSVFKKLPTSQVEYIYEKYHISKENFNMVMVGRLSPEKNQETAIKAIPEIIYRVPNAKLLIIGGGDQKFYLNLIAKLKVEDSVTLLGKVPDEDMVPLFNIGNLFVHAGLVELESMVTLEAMACGLPVLISDGPASAASGLINSNGLTFKEKDENDLAIKAISMILDTKLLKTLANQSLLSVKNYDIDESITHLTELFHFYIERVTWRERYKRFSVFFTIAVIIFLTFSYFFLPKSIRNSLLKRIH